MEKVHNIYKGQLKDGKMHGEGIMQYVNGDRYEGYWEDGKFHGIGIYTWANRSSYVGEWKDGKMHGQGKYTFADGIYYVGQFKDGKFHGIGIRQYANGDSYDGEWKDGKYHGEGTYTWANGSSRKGEWKDGKMHGKGTYTFDDGHHFEGEWKDDEIIVESTKTKEENETLTLLLRSTKMNGEKRPSKYETDKFINGGEKVEVDVCEGKKQVLAKTKEFAENNQDKDKYRIVFDQHGFENGGNDMGIDEGCAKEILESLAGKSKNIIKNIIISDLACYGATAKHFFKVAQDVAISNEVNIKLRFAQQDRVCIAVGNQKYSTATVGEDGPLEKRESIEFLKDGTVILKHHDGSKYVGGWENGEMEGKGTHIDSDGNRYEGEWKNGEMEGKGILTYQDGSIFEGEWKNGEMEGLGRVTLKDGSRYEVEWKGGEMVKKRELEGSKPKKTLKPSQAKILKIGTLALAKS
jgi:hypothetical protein